MGNDHRKGLGSLRHKLTGKPIKFGRATTDADLRKENGKPILVETVVVFEKKIIRMITGFQICPMTILIIANTQSKGEATTDKEKTIKVPE